MTEERQRSKPWRDPIVEEVREARMALFGAASYDLHELCRTLRERQEASGHRIIRAPSRADGQPSKTK